MAAEISVVIPARNEGARLIDTILSFARGRATGARIEFIIADDASDEDPSHFLAAAGETLLAEPAIDIRVVRLEARHGVPRARNRAASLATAPILFITDAHIAVSHGWDEIVLTHVAPRTIVAGVITEENTAFVGYGCRLVVPFMGTYWNRDEPPGPVPVQVAACPATALTKALYDELGGYDDGMQLYGAAEPEFSLHAWLSGAEILLHPDLRVAHRFKPRREREAFIADVRPAMVHNALRFGLTYLSEAGCLQLLRYQARKFPHLFEEAIAAVQRSDVWDRRRALERSLPRRFDWFVRRFGLKDQVGGEILT